jgi:putative protein kinase ArgK-like GTPase of G3E family
MFLQAPNLPSLHRCRKESLEKEGLTKTLQFGQQIRTDTGSDSTMVTKLLARELDLTGKPYQLTLTGIGGCEKVSLPINSLEEEFSKQFRDVLVVQ